MDWLTPKETGLLLGISPSTVRVWVQEDKLEARLINERGDRRISRKSILAHLSTDASEKNENSGLREALYTRVSGRGDQLSSLDNQERELRKHAQGRIVLTTRDIGSGLKENRPGLNRLLRAAEKGQIDQVSITHKDRLTRFGYQTLVRLFNAHGVEVRVLHETPADAQEELLQDFMSLIASFSGRLYGQRSAAARQRLLNEAGA